MLGSTMLDGWVGGWVCIRQRNEEEEEEEDGTSLSRNLRYACIRNESNVSNCMELALARKKDTS